MAVPVKVYSDKTNLDGQHQLSARPLHITLENIPLSAQGQLGGHELLAFLPVLKEVPKAEGCDDLSGAAFRRRRQELTQQCLDALFGALRPLCARHATTSQSICVVAALSESCSNLVNLFPNTEMCRASPHARSFEWQPPLTD